MSSSLLGRSFQYDVAFSFLGKDESLAVSLNDLIQDRLSTFLYSKRQETVAGTDGETAFTRVFGEQSRLVVVLYRAGWGETPFTRIEEKAIRNRAYDEGYDFAIFIPLDTPPNVPAWVPKTRLWVGLKRWGLEGAASVIEARVHELGGSAHTETVIDRAARLQRQIEFEQHRYAFLHSEDGVRTADADFHELWSTLERLASQASSSSVRLTAQQIAPGHMEVVGRGHTLTLAWASMYRNSLDGSELEVILWEGAAPGPNRFLASPKKVRTCSFTFDLLTPDQFVWRSASSGHRAFGAEELASFVLKRLLDEISDAEERRARAER